MDWISTKNILAKEVITSNRENVPIDYMETQARLYTSSGTLKYFSSMVYNDSAAINIRDGIEGYVRSKDLSPTPSNPEEAVVMAELAKTDRTIPLYSLDGEVIGAFVVNAIEENVVNSIRVSYDD